MPAQLARSALQDDRVLAVWPDGVSHVDECQGDAAWHLVDISNDTPRSGKFVYDTPQKASTVYVADTWVDVDHPQFEGRAERGFASTEGENGHGTHVAGLVGSAQYGVNRKAKIVSVQVLNNEGSGTWS